MAYTYVIQAGIVLFGLFIWRSWVSTRPRYNPPPGPKGLPLVGNIFDLPHRGVPEFQHWLKFKDRYGPISSMKVMGQTIVIIHDKQAAHDLLGTQSKKTSARPRFEFGCTMCGFDSFLPLRQFDDDFRRQRQLVVRQLGNASAFTEIQEEEARRFVLDVLNEPKNLVKHFQIGTSAVFLKAVYGYSIHRSEIDPLIDLTERVVANVETALVPLTWVVDLIPALKYLPTCVPGMGFKKTAKRWRNMIQALVDTPYVFVRRQMETGCYRSSFVSALVEQYSRSDIKQSKLAAGVRIPGLKDRENLPYIEALVKEAYRWNPFAPMGFAHVSEEEIAYKDYFIPKGAFLLPVIWWFCHDPDVYKNPSAFEPERYLEPRIEPDPRGTTFGFGRRVCPGRTFVHSLLFLTVAQTLAVFSITKPVDEHGLETEINLEYAAGIANRPQNFRYHIAPRSDLHDELIENSIVKQPFEKGHANFLEDDQRILEIGSVIHLDR